MLTFDLQIVLLTSVHLGADNESVDVIRLTRDPRGRPCIRASTLKGIHRASCEQIAQALGLFRCGSPAANQMCQPRPGETLCAVCRIFGSPWVPGRVFYHDLIASISPGTEKRVRVVRVAQSRRRRVRLAIYEREREVLPPGTVFRGKINHLLSDDLSTGLALAGLRSIAAIGAGSAVGYGLCQVEARALDGENRPVDESTLAAALERARVRKP